MCFELVIDTKEVFGDELGDLSGSDDNDTKSEQHEKSVAGAADEDSTHRHESVSFVFRQLGDFEGLQF